jgi:ketosteroid isomerase-like protein
MSQENVEILRQGFAEFARGDMDAVLERLDPNVDWRPAIAPILGVETIRGREAVIAFFTRDLSEGFDEFRAEPLAYEDLGDAVLVTVRYAGRGESSGVEIDQTFVSLYRLRNGRTVSMCDYATRAEALEAAGLREQVMSEENGRVMGRNEQKGEAHRIDLERLRRNYEAFGQGDWDQAQELLDPDIRWSDPPQMAGGGVHHGKDAVRRAWREAFEEIWVDYRLEPQQMIPSGDLLFVHAVVSGRSRHEGMEVSTDLFQVWKFRDGLAIKHESFFEREVALRAAGLRE